MNDTEKSDIQDRVLAAIQSAGRPVSNPDIYEIDDSLESGQISSSLYALHKAGKVAKAGTIYSKKGKREIPTYIPLFPVDQMPTVAPTYTVAPQEEQRSEYEQMLAGETLADDVEAALDDADAEATEYAWGNRAELPAGLAARVAQYRVAARDTRGIEYASIVRAVAEQYEILDDDIAAALHDAATTLEGMA